MNNKRSISHFSFADSTFKSFHLSEDNALTIFMNTWQEEPFKIIFSNTIQFSYKLGDIPNDLYEIFNANSFLDEALIRQYTSSRINALCPQGTEKTGRSSNCATACGTFHKPDKTTSF